MILSEGFSVKRANLTKAEPCLQHGYESFIQMKRQMTDDSTISIQTVTQ